MCNFNAASCCFCRQCNFSCCHRQMTNGKCLTSDIQDNEYQRPTKLSYEKIAKKKVSTKLKSASEGKSVLKGDSSKCADDTSTMPICQSWTQEGKESCSKCTSRSFDVESEPQPNETKSKQKKFSQAKTLHKKTLRKKVNNQLQRNDSLSKTCTRTDCVNNKKTDTMWFECNVPVRVGIPGSLAVNAPCNLFNSNMQLEISEGSTKDSSTDNYNNSLVKSCPNPALQPLAKNKMYITVRPLTGIGVSAMPAGQPPVIERRTQHTVPKLLPNPPQPTASNCRPNAKSMIETLSNFVEAIRLIEVVCKNKSRTKDNRSTRKHKKKISLHKPIKEHKSPSSQSSKKLDSSNSTSSLENKPSIHKKSAKAAVRRLAHENSLERDKSKSKVGLKVSKSRSITAQTTKKADIQNTAKKEYRMPTSNSSEKVKKINSKPEPKGLHNLLASLEAPAISNDWFAQLPDNKLNINRDHVTIVNRCECSTPNISSSSIKQTNRSIIGRTRSKVSMTSDSLSQNDAASRSNVRKSKRPFDKNVRDESATAISNKFPAMQFKKALRDRQQVFLNKLQESIKDEKHPNCNCCTILQQYLQDQQYEQKSHQQEKDTKLPVRKGIQHQPQQHKQLQRQEKQQHGIQHNQHQGKQSKKQQELKYRESNSKLKHKPCCQKRCSDLQQQRQKDFQQPKPQAETQQLLQHKGQLSSQNFQDPMDYNRLPQQPQRDKQPKEIQKRQKGVLIESKPRIRWSDSSSYVSQPTESSNDYKSTTGNPILKSSLTKLILPAQTNNKESKACNNYPEYTDRKGQKRMVSNEFYMKTLAKYGIKFMPSDCLLSDSGLNSFQANCSNA